MYGILKIPRNHSTISKTETKALKELRANTSIIIKRVDKGGGTVIMDKEKYIQEALRQLADISTYQPLSCDPTEQLKTLIRTVLDEAHRDGIINATVRKALETKSPRVLESLAENPQTPG